jgi:hypothetical protein
MSRDNPLAAQAVGSPAAAFRSFPNHDKTTRHYIRDEPFLCIQACVANSVACQTLAVP